MISHVSFKIISGMAEVFNVFLYSPSTYDFVPLVDFVSETRLLQLINEFRQRSPLMNLGFALRTRNSSQFPTFLQRPTCYPRRTSTWPTDSSSYYLCLDVPDETAKLI